MHINTTTTTTSLESTTLLNVSVVLYIYIYQLTNRNLKPGNKLNLSVSGRIGHYLLLLLPRVGVFKLQKYNSKQKNNKRLYVFENMFKINNNFLFVV